MQTQLVPTVSLTIHPALKDLPEWADDDPQFEVFCRDIHERGFDYPLKATAKHQVVDGRHRLRAAKRLKLETVPVDIVQDKDVPRLVLHYINQRRHYSKGALAYMAVPLLQGTAQSQELFAAAFGISRALLQQALEVRQIFADNGKPGEEYRTDVEPRILSGEVGSARSLPVGRDARQQKRPKKQPPNFELWGRSLTDFQKRFSFWDKFDVGAKNTVLAKFQTVVESMPHELLLKLSQKISHEVKHRKKEDK
jgi:hypothetical protein